MEKISPSELLKKTILEISEFDARYDDFEEHKQVVLKSYKNLTPKLRVELCEQIGYLLRNQFVNNSRLDRLMYLFVWLIAADRDWESANKFLSTIFINNNSSEFFKEMSICLLDIADNELAGKHPKIALGQASVVILTELGLHLASQTANSGIDFREATRVVEYITTNLLSRSNINNNAMRISLLHYLSACKCNGHATMQLSRVLGRFGQSLLEQLFLSLFEDKKKKNAAFFYLLKHLNVFFISSPTLEKMTHDILKHYMLKYPEEFPKFLTLYAEFLTREEIPLKVTAKHLALLLTEAIEVSQKPLADKMSDILLFHLKNFRYVSFAMFKQELDKAIKIVEPFAKHSSKTSSVAANFLDIARIMEMEDEGDFTKVVPINVGKKAKKSIDKYAHLGEEPSPLESMFLLAS